MRLERAGDDAFTNRYAVTEALFAPGQRSDRYVIQPVSVTSSVPETSPACPAQGSAFSRPGLDARQALWREMEGEG